MNPIANCDFPGWVGESETSVPTLDPPNGDVSILAGTVLTHFILTNIFVIL